jgi:ribosome-associated protein
MTIMTEEFEYDGPSKSELKRQSTDLQALGEALIGLPDNEFNALPLPEILRDAVLLARRITAHGGLYRQKQYIGKLMRKIDAEPIRVALAARENQGRVDALRFRRVEQWRDRLIAEGPDAIAILREESAAQLDAGAIATLIRRARQERSDGSTPKAARELFRVLRDALAAAPDPS